MGNKTKNLFRQELGELAAFIKRNYREIAVICLGTLFLTLNRYFPIGPVWASALLYFAALPLLAITILLRRNPLSFGLQLGKVKIWSLHTAVTMAVAVPILYVSSLMAPLEHFYTMPGFNIARYSLETAMYMLAWEFLFRGFLLFGLKEKFGEGSILVQMIPFALLHLGKPAIETISTILVGSYLGYVAYRGESYWPAFIIHLFINILFRVYVNMLA